MLKACKAFVAYKSMSAIPGYLRDSPSSINVLCPKPKNKPSKTRPTTASFRCKSGKESVVGRKGRHAEAERRASTSPATPASK